MSIPSVAIVGRANVGKSSIFNAICKERVAIVDPTPGVTRDRVAREVRLGDRLIELVDTGGVGMESATEIVEDVEMQIEIAVTQADLVLLVVDAQVGVHPLDLTISRRLRAAGKSVLVVANKAERRIDGRSVGDFHALGLGEPHPMSAAHRRGIGDLVERVAQELPPAAPAPAESLAARLAIVGRRNVGKSALINRLAQGPRVIVSELPGTTRDAVDVRIQVGDEAVVIIDTAGVRKRQQVKDSVDFYSQARTEDAVRRADVVVLMLEAPGEIGKLDKQLAAYVVEHYKPCLVAVNKLDLVEGINPAEFVEYVRFHLPNLRFAPVTCISALTGHNVPALLDMAHGLREQSLVRVRTSELNRAMQSITARKRPPSKTNKLGNILYATQVGAAPPTIALFANDSARITPDYERYLANQLRSELPFHNVPIRFVTRRRHGAGEEGERDQ